MVQEFLTMKNVTKRFPGVRALDDVTITINKGEVMGLLGENGAGKSTLMKVLAGIHQMDEGKIVIEGKEYDFWNDKTALENGIGCVHQELNLAESLSIAENIYMGRLPYKNKALGIVDFAKLYSDTKEVLKKLGLDYSPKEIVGNLTTAKKQLIEIAKSVSMNCKVIIFDEPTTSLSDKDVQNLFKIIKQMREEGKAIVYISHRLNEVFQICDKVDVLRDSRFIDSKPVEGLTRDDVIKLMVGREIKDLYPARESKASDEIVLETKDVCDNIGLVKSASIKLKKGEVLGISGLVGAGRTEFVRLIFGADKIKSGSVYLKGKQLNIKSPIDSIDNGICLLTEDRKHQGLALDMSISDNINIASLSSPILDFNKINKASNEFKQKLQIKTNNLNVLVKTLSGGNQQKVVLAKWLNTNCDIFIFDEPTKGIDVGAKLEIYNIINGLIYEGKSVIMISSELPELMGMCDRAYVMCEGKITGEVKREDFSQEYIMQLSTLGGM